MAYVVRTASGPQAPSSSLVPDGYPRPPGCAGHDPHARRRRIPPRATSATFLPLPRPDGEKAGLDFAVQQKMRYVQCMSKQRRSTKKISRTGVLALSLFLMVGSMSWAQYGPFAELPGNWAGEGQTFSGDKKELQLRCRAIYKVSERGNELTQDLLCADGHSEFHLMTNVNYRGGIVSGTWSEDRSFRKSGKLEGRAAGGHFEVNIIMDDASVATLSLTTYGNIQSARISSAIIGNTSIRLFRSPF
jgi:hypothetical protein